MRGSQEALFRGRHFRSEVIVLCLRWYLRYPLSYRDLEEMMTERGLSVDHSTIGRWVLHCSPRCVIWAAPGGSMKLTCAWPANGLTYRSPASNSAEIYFSGLYARSIPRFRASFLPAHCCGGMLLIGCHGSNSMKSSIADRSQSQNVSKTAVCSQPGSAKSWITTTRSRSPRCQHATSSQSVRKANGTKSRVGNLSFRPALRLTEYCPLGNPPWPKVRQPCFHRTQENAADSETTKACPFRSSIRYESFRG